MERTRGIRKSQTGQKDPGHESVIEGSKISPPSPVTGKRKRDSENHDSGSSNEINVQVIVGSYERALHGVIISISHEQLSSADGEPAISFSDNFLFNAHSSSIRCLALSPPSDSAGNKAVKRFLATGGTDERINLYSIAAAALSRRNKSPKLFTPTSSTNVQVGVLLHHTSTVSALSFPSRTKLLTASYDNTIAVARARDWTVLSVVRAPIPKTAGRPSGDTAAPGEVPAGINAIAVHPSAKLCLSVGQGEKCMRLWNLVTGKKAGVLTFDKKTLLALGEGRWRGGEGKTVVWSDDGEEFAVAFERGAILYGQDCQIRGVAKLPRTKVCQMRYIPSATSDTTTDEPRRVLAISTEDGRIVFFTSQSSNVAENSSDISGANQSLPVIGQLGNTLHGNRIKDFQILPIDLASDENSPTMLFIMGNSDGAISVSRLGLSELEPRKTAGKENEIHKLDKAYTNGNDIRNHVNDSIPTVGRLLGTYQTNKRITCLSAFIMDAPAAADAKEEDGIEEEWSGFDESQESDSSQSSN